MGTLDYAVLGLLARESLTGYALTCRMDKPVGYVWSAKHSQIYPVLHALEGEGLVRHRVVDGRGPRATKRYSITAAGRRVLRSWVVSPLAPPEAKSELMLRVRALWVVSPEAAEVLIAQALQQHRERLNVYRREEASFAVEDTFDVTRPGFSSYATLRCGIGSEEQMLAWCNWLLGSLRKYSVASVASD